MIKRIILFLKYDLIIYLIDALIFSLFILIIFYAYIDYKKSKEIKEEKEIIFYELNIKKTIWIYQKANKKFTFEEIYNMFNPIYDYVIKRNDLLVKQLPINKIDLKLIWTAQIVNETGYLVGSQNYTYFNLLGIKRVNNFPYFYKRTVEYNRRTKKRKKSNEPFANFFHYYDNFEIWLDKIVNNPLYSKSLDARNREEFIRIFAKTWATNPEYADVIINIIEKNEKNVK